MLRTELLAYLASTCLINVFLISGLLQPADARTSEPSKSGNPVDLASTSSSQDCPYRALLQDRDAESHFSRFSWSEIRDFKHLNDTIDEHDLDSILNSRPAGETLNADIDEHNLDSILNSQFNQREILLARCCA